MQGDFEISGVYAREFADGDKNGVEVVVQLGGGAVGRAVLPPEAGFGGNTLDQIKATLNDVLTAADSYDYHGGDQSGEVAAVTNVSGLLGHEVAAAASQAITRACAAQMQSSMIMK